MLVLSPIRDVIADMLAALQDNEWQTRHAAENTYCPYCATNEDTWTDQREHRPGCHFVHLVARAEEVLGRLDKIKNDPRG